MIHHWPLDDNNTQQTLTSSFRISLLFKQPFSIQKPLFVNFVKILDWSTSVCVCQSILPLAKSLLRGQNISIWCLCIIWKHQHLMSMYHLNGYMVIDNQRLDQVCFAADVIYADTHGGSLTEKEMLSAKSNN